MQTYGVHNAKGWNSMSTSNPSRWQFFFRKNTLVFSFLLTFLFFQSPNSNGQIIINEILPGGTIEIKNIGTSTIDVSAYWLCDFPSYQQISGSNIICGNTMLGAGEILAVDNFNVVSSTDGEMGLYTSSSFGSSSAIIDYVEWGSTGHTRSSVAVAAGIWTTGDFVAAFGASESLEFDGAGESSSDWGINATPTVCNENSNAGTTCTATVGNITLADGTTSTSICVDGVADPLAVTTSGGTGTASWIITNTAGDILGLPMAGPFDLDGAGTGTCQIWYVRSESDFAGAMVGNNLTDLTGCFALSNPIEVIREAADGGMVTLADGSTSYSNCAGNIVFDVTHTTTAPNLSYWYIITDNNDNILAWQNSTQGGTLDLSAAPAGECHVWGWSYRGLADPVVGENISTLNDDSCESISSNWVTVYREIPDGGMVTLADGSTSYSNCAGNIVFDVVHTTTAPNLSYWYIITDNNDNILAWQNSTQGGTLDLSAAPAGECHVWGWNYKGLADPVVGENISTLNDDSCESISSNWVTVYREIPDGGMVTLADGSTSYSNCAGNIVFDVVHTTTAPNLSYWYIITDNNDNILAWQNSTQGGTLDLSAAPAGECHVWGWNYKGLADPVVGENISTLADDACEDISDNWVTIYREIPDGGTVTLADGSTTYTGIAGNIMIDVIHNTTAPNLSYWYVITDDNDNILAWQNSTQGGALDLSGAPAGECHVWGWNYKGLADPVVGNNISTLSDDDCEDISDSFVTVIRQDPNCTATVGNITLADGSTSTSICVDGVADPLAVTTSGGTGTASWIITNTAGDILGLPMAGPFDLDGAGTGTCQIWYVRSESDFAGAMVGNNLTDLTGCFALSNPIEVIREAADGGMVTLADGSSSYANCAGNIVFDVVHTTTAPNLSYWYIITDNNDNILAWQNSTQGGTLDLSAAPAGECHVWGWSYRGLPDPVVGDHITTLDDDSCESISNNWVTIYREIPDGGMVTLADGNTSYSNCAGDIIFDVVHTTTAPNLSYWYIITDNNDNILAWQNSTQGGTLDLSAAPAGECHVWGWNYKGLADPVVGDNISTLADDDCEDISDNWVTIYREIPDGGMVALADGSTSYSNCAGDIIFDVVHTTTAPNLSYWYIITDNNDNILAWQNSTQGGTLDLSVAPAGECHIWGWNYKGLADPIVGDNISTLSDDDCEDISDNWVTIYREIPDGGMITLADGSTSYSNCAGNIVFDVVHTTTAPNLSYWYIITDNNDNILAWQNSTQGGTLDLSVAPAGECHIWGWNYKGLADPVVGDNISTLADDDCEDISDDWVTVYREVPDGGTVDSDLGTEFTICVDGTPDPINVTHVTTAPNLSYWYIITDDSDNILAWSTDPVIDLDGAGVGVCRIWGWNYKGLADPIVGDNISTLMDDDCEDISDNFIQVTRIDTGAPCITSTRDLESVSYLQISPNPANNFVNIEYEGLDANQGVLNVIDVTGRTLQQIQLSQENDNIQMDISNIQSGFYYIRIESKDKISTTKLSIIK